MKLQIGDLVGPYQLREERGVGGMATVYKAWHTGLHRFEALKIPREKHADSAYVLRLLTEARLAAGLRHPNIVAIHGVSDPGSPVPYFAMEWIEGRDLANHLQEGGSMGLDQIIAILDKVATALDFAHQKRVVHRDIKPANILLQDSEEEGVYFPKVVDFGISRAAEEEDGATRLTRSGMLVGTPEYMSPEQSGSGDLVERFTDIYSLGILAYEMLSGTPPFTAGDGVSRLAILIQHVRDKPPTLGAVLGAHSTALEAVIQCALAKKPSERYPDCTSFVRALRDVANLESGSVPISSKSQKDLSPIGVHTLEKTPFDGNRPHLLDVKTLAEMPGSLQGSAPRQDSQLRTGPHAGPHAGPHTAMASAPVGTLPLHVGAPTAHLGSVNTNLHNPDHFTSLGESTPATELFTPTEQHWQRYRRDTRSSFRALSLATLGGVLAGALIVHTILGRQEENASNRPATTSTRQTAAGGTPSVRPSLQVPAKPPALPKAASNTIASSSKVGPDFARSRPDLADAGPDLARLASDSPAKPPTRTLASAKPKIADSSPSGSTQPQATPTRKPVAKKLVARKPVARKPVAKKWAAVNRPIVRQPVKKSPEPQRRALSVPLPP